VREAWAEANRLAAGGKPTAADVREAVASNDAGATSGHHGHWKPPERKRRAPRTERDADRFIKRAIRSGFTPELLRGALDRAYPESAEGRPATPDEEAQYGRALSLLDDDDGAAS
jgi:hypothetical protein